jgi:hypothetical protein
MSRIGLAAMFGTDVLPTCSIASAVGPRAFSILPASTANASVQRGFGSSSLTIF